MKTAYGIHVNFIRTIPVQSVAMVRNILVFQP